jgi:hypothetical protein
MKLFNTLKISCFLIVAFVIRTQFSFSQGASEYGGGIKLKIDESGSKYIRFITWNQVWMRSMQMNPATAVSGESVERHNDIALRRLRFLAYAQISPRYMILTHFGINNQTFNGGGAASSSGTGAYGVGKKPGIFFHDAWNEYAVFLPKPDKKFSLSIGMGLHYVMGLSRLTMASTLNNMAIDSPIFNWALVDNSDQFARQMGTFVKGKYGRFEYRMSLNKPFSTNLTPTDVTVPENAVAVDNSGNSRFSFASYFEYQFFDIESNFLPFKVGSYVGTKKMLNIGIGSYIAPKGTKSSVNGEIQSHTIQLFSADAFLDLPVGNKDKKMALTSYSVYYNYNFGPNYLRNIGIMNVGAHDPLSTKIPALSGFGNAQPLIGTGSIFYTQLGFLLPNTKETPKLRIQPFAAYCHKNFDALDKASNQFDLGANLYLHGHHAKITPQFSTRPVYDTKSTYRLMSEILVQFQVFL